jgi:hypothetical protein
MTDKQYQFQHDGVDYIIEKDPGTIGFNENNVKYNSNGTPRCRTGWGYGRVGGESPYWASSLKNAKLAIQGVETGDVVFA